MKKTIVLLLSLFLFSTTLVQAAPPRQQDEGQSYIVQADDWLSKLADKNYGDSLAWPAIWLATNAKAMADDTFATIENPNIIEIGQKLWLPGQAEAGRLLAEYAASGSESMAITPATATTTDKVDAQAEETIVTESAGETEEITSEAMTVELDEPTVANEVPLIEIPLAGPITNSNAEISGLAWYGDYLILLPQYPNFATKTSDGFIFALPKAGLLAYLDGADAEPLEPLQIPIEAPGLAEGIKNFEGFEAIAFSGDNAYLTIESRAEGGMQGFLVTGRMAANLSALTFNVDDRAGIEPQAPISNHTDETLFVADDMLVTLYESTGAGLVSEPVAHRFDTTLAAVDTIPYVNIEYRITDATALDENNRFWAINYFFPGDEVLRPENDPIADRAGKGPTHAEYDHVERLVEFQYDETGITLTETAPIQIELIEDARNWEGLVRLEDRGFLIATDKWPQTILGFVPWP